MNILNLTYNRIQKKNSSEYEMELLQRLAKEWLAILQRVAKKGPSLLADLQKENLAENERLALFAAMSSLFKEVDDIIQRLTLLFLPGEGNALPSPPSTLLQSSEGSAWIWYSFHLFFQSWNPETADQQLWLLARPVLTAGPSVQEKERKEVVSFYELTKLLIQAAHSLHLQYREGAEMED